jgi:hypothetical protein
VLRNHGLVHDSVIQIDLDLAPCSLLAPASVAYLAGLGGCLRLGRADRLMCASAPVPTLLSVSARAQVRTGFVVYAGPFAGCGRGLLVGARKLVYRRRPQGPDFTSLTPPTTGGLH